jgi:predicted ATP-grasp superfamily ATP-dependent carboligase
MIYLTDIPFNWKTLLIKYNILTNENIKNDDIIIPMSYNGYIKYNLYKQNILHNNLEMIDILENKVLFAIFMNDNFPEYIPKTIYYSFNNYKYNDTNVNNIDLIYKPAIGFGGNNISIIEKYSDDMTNCIIQQYITFEIYYSGHILVIDGKIIYKIYFKARNLNKYYIRRGPIVNYEILYEPDFDDSIFPILLEKLNLTLIICIDFMVKNNKIIIFEINPRFGGSLISNIKLCNRFLHLLLQYKNIDSLLLKKNNKQLLKKSTYKK